MDNSDIKICQGCKENNWEIKEPIVYTNPSEQSYCVFHAPCNNKLDKDGNHIDKQKYSEMVFKLIDDATDENLKTRNQKHCDMSGVIFPWDISFSSHKPSIKNTLQRITFAKAKFIGKELFNNVSFCGKVDFSRTEFHSKVDFSKAEFMDEAVFLNTVFYSRSNFSFITAGDIVEFTKTQFLGVSTYFGVEVQKNGRISFSLIKSSHIEQLKFMSSELHCIQFRHCRFPNRLALERHGGNIPGIKKENYLQCEELYRALKHRAAEEHDQPQVSHWHFREKLMHLKGLLLSANCNALIETVEDSNLCKGSRALAWWELFRALPWRLRISLPFLYWISSGFGERPTRGAVCLIVLVLLPLIFLTPLKLIETCWSLTPDGQRIAEVLLEWVRCMPFAKLDAPTPNPPTILSALRTMLSYGFQLVIGLQAALFALAVRNRFRR